MTTAEKQRFLGQFETDAGAYLDRLYLLGISEVFDNPEPVEGDLDHANQNVLDALQVMLDKLGSTGTMMLAIGPMASGKSTAMAKLFRTLNGEGREVSLWKHTFDEERVGESNRLWLQGGERGIVTEIGTKLYQGIKDVWEFSENWRSGSVQILDEIMFTGAGNPPHINADLFMRLRDRSEQRGIKLVVAGLHSDFKRVIWPNIPVAVQMSDLGIFDFRGRCDHQGCGENSIFTQRMVSLKEGDRVIATRPSHVGELVVRVGSVLGDDDYKAMCQNHHRVLTPAEAMAFDFQYGKDSEDYGL